MTFMTKPVIVEAFRLGDQFPPKWFTDRLLAEDGVRSKEEDGKLVYYINTLNHGWMKAYPHRDYIVLSPVDGMYPCEISMFELMHDRVEAVK